MRRAGRAWLRAAQVVAVCAMLLGSVGPGMLPAAQGSPRPAGPPVPSRCDPDGQQASGAVYRICMPPAADWNGEPVNTASRAASTSSVPQKGA